MAPKTLRVSKLDSRFCQVPPSLLPQAVQHMLREFAAVDCMRMSEDGVLYVQFFSYEAARKVKSQSPTQIPLKLEWSFSNLDLHLRYPPDTVSVTHVEPETDSAVEKVQKPIPGSDFNQFLPCQAPDKQRCDIQQIQQIP